MGCVKTFRLAKEFNKRVFWMSQRDEMRWCDVKTEVGGRAGFDRSDGRESGISGRILDNKSYEVEVAQLP